MSRILRSASAGLGAALAALVPVAADASGSKLVTASSGPLRATLTPPARTPKINTKVPLRVTATLHGKPAHATALYEFVFAGMVVSTQNPYGKKPYAFTGHFRDTLDFPAQAAGQPLTFRVVVKAGGHTVNLNSPVTPRR